MKILIFNRNNVLSDVEEELLRRGHELLPHDGKKTTWKKADVIVIWHETGLANWREWVTGVKKAGKRVVLIQHGRKGTSRIYPPFNESLISDIICVWGENDKRRYMETGTPEDKIKITGTTIFSHLKNKVSHEGLNVVFSPEHWDEEVVENFIVAGQLRKLKDVKVITKTLQGSHQEELYDNVISSDRNSKEHFGIVADVLSKADCVVALSESTFELCAQILDIPVVIADIWIPKSCDGDDRYKEYKREYSNACTRVKDITKLNEEVYKALKHKALERERKEVAVFEGGVNIMNPLENIINVIENG